MKGNVECKLNPREQHNIHNFASTSSLEIKFDYDKPPQKVQLVGIINVTPNSYYDGGQYNTTKNAIAHGKQLIKEGADYLDIGGEATNPKCLQRVTLNEELRRIMPVIEALAPLAKLSVDTTKPEVAKRALEAGACMLNDISGFTNPKMCEVAADFEAKLCLMHSHGNVKEMQTMTYQEGIIPAISSFFEKQIEWVQSFGIDKDRLILDPGIGFGKTVEDNYNILNHLDAFKTFDLPLYLGISRKSFLQRSLNRPAEECLPATLTCATVSALRGVSYLRVHDVQAHHDLFKVLGRLTGECF